MSKPNLNIMECTLRDGSYAIDFQFTARDTAVIAAALENAGFDYIEIGHGVGMNASNAGKGAAAATDEEYMQAAAGTLRRARWGMFFIPGIGRHEDLELAARYRMDFVRIGTNANEVAESKDYIEHAKGLGMFVSANLMKSYALPPRELAAQAKLSEGYGADVVSLVDSAGCMLPGEVAAYMAALQEVLTVPVGFHCHDNLAMGMANALTAVGCGARFIDSTLQGMGRGGGNPATEILVTVLKKQGIDLGIDPNRLMDLSGRIIKPMLQDRGLDPINVTLGFAGFHSSHLKTIAKYADLYGVDQRDLIVAVSEVDIVNAPEGLVEEKARELQRRRRSEGAGLHLVSLPRFAFPAPEGGGLADESLTAAARKVANEAKTAAKKRGLLSVFNVVAAPRPAGRASVSRFIQEEFDYVIGGVELDNPEQLREVVEAVDGVVDVLFVDSELKPYLACPLTATAAAAARKSRVLGYKDNDVWARSVDRQIAAMLQGVHGRRITVYGLDDLALKLALSLLEQGAEVTLSAGDAEGLRAGAEAVGRLALVPARLRAEADPVAAAEGSEALVAFSSRRAVIDLPMLRAMADGGVVFDAGIGSVSADAIEYGKGRGIRVVRPDMRAALAAELTSVLGTHRIVNSLMGRGEVAGVPVVAGGLVGRYGEVVLDSMSSPSRVIGVADGRGAVIYDGRPEFTEDLRKVEDELLRKQVAAE